MYMYMYMCVCVCVRMYVCNKSTAKQHRRQQRLNSASPAPQQRLNSASTAPHQRLTSNLSSVVTALAGKILNGNVFFFPRETSLNMSCPQTRNAPRPTLRRSIHHL